MRIARLAVVLLLAVVGFYLGYMHASGDGDPTGLRVEAEAARAMADSLTELVETVTAREEAREAEHLDSIAALRTARSEVVRLRRAPQTRVDSLVQLVPDSISLRVAIDLERTLWAEEVSALEAIIAEGEKVRASLRLRLQVERDARLAVAEEAERWRKLAEAEHARGNRWRLATGAVAILAAVLGAIR